MSNNLFGVDLAGIIHQAISPGVLAATLVKRTPGTRTVGALTGGTNATSTSYACRGFVDTYSHFQIASGLVKAQDKKVVLIGKSISSGTVSPTPGDQVTIEGATYEVVAVERDPAGATFTVQAR